MGYLLKQSSTAHPLLFLIVQSADHITGLTGASPTVTLSKDGAAFASPSGSVSELANGWYKVAGNATDTNTTGSLLLHATAASADPVDDEYRVVAFDPDDGVHLGLTSLPNAVAGVSGGMPLLGETLQLLDANDVAAIWAAATRTLTALSNVTVGAYAAGEDPATLLLASPANKLATDSTGRVTVGTNDDKTGYTASTVSDKTGYALTTAEHTAISGTDVPAALNGSALVQQLSALLGSATVAGNVVTFSTPDNAHHWTATYSPSIADATSITVAQVD